MMEKEQDEQIVHIKQQLIKNNKRIHSAYQRTIESSSSLLKVGNKAVMKNLDNIELSEEIKIEFMLRFVCQVDLYTTFPYVKRDHLEEEIM